MAEPSRTRKVGFWLLLGLTSTAFAEVAFPGTPFDVVTLAFVVGPIYLLHVVVLAGVLFETDRVTVASLYLAGTLLGLYEAYVTKVVWAPVGDPLPVRVVGVYPFETLSLVLFWHPLMAFLVPVAVVEAAATDSGRTLPSAFVDHRYAPHLVAVAVASLAVVHGTLGGGPATTFVETALTATGLLGALAAWRLTGGHRYEMGVLLPGRRELWALAVALLGLYLLFGATVRPEALPGRPVPHLVVVGMYGVLGGLLLATVSGEADDASAGSVTFTWPRAVGGFGAFLVASTAAGFLLAPLATVVFLAYFAGSTLLGVGTLAAVGVETLGRGR